MEDNKRLVRNTRRNILSLAMLWRYFVTWHHQQKRDRHLTSKSLFLEWIVSPNVDNSWMRKFHCHMLLQSISPSTATFTLHWDEEMGSVFFLAWFKVIFNAEWAPWNAQATILGELGPSRAIQIPFKWHWLLALSKPLPLWPNKAHVNKAKLTSDSLRWGQKCGCDFLQHQRSVEASTSEAKAPGQKAAIHSAVVISAGFWPRVRG